jgi:hypothetical protein
MTVESFWLAVGTNHAVLASALSEKLNTLCYIILGEKSAINNSAFHLNSAQQYVKM